MVLLIGFLVLAIFLLPIQTRDQRSSVLVLTAILFGLVGASLAGTAVIAINAPLRKGGRVSITVAAGLVFLLIGYLVPPQFNSYYTPIECLSVSAGPDVSANTTQQNEPSPEQKQPSVEQKGKNPGQTC